MMNGRVKTLHPLIHGGILGDRDIHQADADANGVQWIDLVAVNLYPFEQTIQKDIDLSTAVETIDIGGPTMVRAAAKNHKHVTVVVDPNDYQPVLDALTSGTQVQALRTRLAVKAFEAHGSIRQYHFGLARGGCWLYGLSEREKCRPQAATGAPIW